MLKKILLALALVVAVFAAVVALQPSEFRVSRSATIAAAPPDVFAHVNDLGKWQAWSPWAKVDPAAKATFEGPPAGEGAVFKWSGNSEVGEGSMTVIESRPSERVRFRLDFVKPMPGTSYSEFAFAPQGNQTAVTWTMSGHNNFLAKAICMFMNIDRMMGGQFEKGLANLKAVAEGGRPG
jgi:hypothetical protein